MKPLFVWILDDEVIGVGDTRRAAFENAQTNLEDTLDLIHERGLVTEPPNAADGYGVKVRFSHYPRDEDPRTVIADSLTPLGIEEEGLDTDIIQELLTDAGGGTLADLEQDLGEDLGEDFRKTLARDEGDPQDDPEGPQGHEEGPQDHEEGPQDHEEGPQDHEEDEEGHEEDPGLTGDKTESEYPKGSQVQKGNHGDAMSTPEPTEENESNVNTGNDDTNPLDPPRSG